MTEKDTQQPVLTDDEILQVFADAVGNQEDDARFIDVDRDQAIRIARTLLSKLRAPVADERDRNATISEVVGLCNRIPGATTWNAAEFMYDELQRRAALSSAPIAGERTAFDVVAGLVPPCASRRGNDFREGYLEARVDALRLLRTLASAPVADESPMAKMADALREKARQEQQAYQDSLVQSTEWGPMPHGTEADLPASAPVAGEAQPVAWRYRNEKSKSWNTTTSAIVADVMRESGRTVESLYAAPQASEAVRNAALEEAAQALDRLHEENRRWHNEFRGAAAVVRALKPRAALSAQPGKQAKENYS